MAQPTYEWRPPDRGWREQDLFDLPEDGNRYEIIDGSLHVTPPAGPEHHELADEIRSAMSPSGSYRLAGDPRDRGAGPWRQSHPRSDGVATRCTARANVGRAEHVALVLEVESTGSRRHDRFTKPALYAEAGIPHYWRVERGDFGPVIYRYRLAEGVHYELLGTIGPDDAVTVDEPWPMRLDPSAWPR